MWIQSLISQNFQMRISWKQCKDTNPPGNVEISLALVISQGVEFILS